MAERTGKILVIDDDPHIVKLLHMKLSTDGYRIFTAGGGLEGIKIAFREKPNLIILDVMMPKMDGYQVCRFLRSIPFFDDTRIIIMTVKKGPGDRQRGLLRGGDDYVTKPFVMEDLDLKIKRQLDRNSFHSPEKGAPEKESILNGEENLTEELIVSALNRSLDEEVYRLTLIEEVSKRLVSSVDREEILEMMLAGVISDVGLGWDRAMLMMVDHGEGTISAEVASGIYQSAATGQKRWGELTSSIKDKTLEEVLDGTLDDFRFQRRKREKWMEQFCFKVDPALLSSRNVSEENGMDCISDACRSGELKKEVEKLFNDGEVAAVPIAGRENILGLLVVDRFFSRRPVKPGDLGFLWILCYQVGLALERAALFTLEQERAREMERLSMLNASIMNGVDLGVVFIDLEGRIGSWNRAMAKFSGLGEGIAIGRKLLDIFPDFAGSLVQRRMEEARNTGTSQRVGHFRHAFRKGIEAVFDIRIGMVRGGESRLGLVMIWEDVSLRIDLEQKEQANLQYISNLVDHSGDAILTVNSRGRIRSWNRGAEEILGYSEAEAVGERFSILYEQGSKKEAMNLLRRTASEGKLINVEENLFRKDGEMINVSITSSTIRGGSEKGADISAIIRDVTRRKKVESQLLQTEKLASLGIMAAGMAHEINNPLTSIMMYSQILGMNREISEDDRTCLDRIEEDAGRIAAIVNSLLVFSRPSSRREEPLDIREMAEKAISFIEYQAVVLDIEVKRSYDSSAPPMMGIPTEVQEIILNILVNARDALPDGGRIDVATRYHAPGEAVPAGLTGEMPGGCIEVSIADNGAGIPKENLKKLYDPFFTTKPPGKGTGLGLAVVNRLVENHRGQVTVTSKTGEGTTFRLFFLLPEKEAQVQGTED